jgi:threonine dehydrogenase-like Zn-dependent dehydrogenase
VQTAVELVRTEGRISIIALHPGPAEFNPRGGLFYEKQIELISTSYAPRPDYPPERVRFTLRRNCADILSGLANGSLPYATAVTQSFSYRELPRLYARLAQGQVPGGAICINWA